MNEYKQCTVTWDDLKLSKGKFAVQVAHAVIPAFEWKSKKGRLPTALIQDAGLTEIPPGAITVLGIGPAKEELIDKVTWDLKLV